MPCPLEGLGFVVTDLTGGVVMQKELIIAQLFFGGIVLPEMERSALHSRQSGIEDKLKTVRHALNIIAPHPRS
jgi:hypothetical protein